MVTKKQEARSMEISFKRNGRLRFGKWRNSWDLEKEKKQINRDKNGNKIVVFCKPTLCSSELSLARLVRDLWDDEWNGFELGELGNCSR